MIVESGTGCRPASLTLTLMSWCCHKQRKSLLLHDIGKAHSQGHKQQPQHKQQYYEHNRQKSTFLPTAQITVRQARKGGAHTWTAAPKATASSGLMLLESSRPLKKSDSRLCTLGIRVDPPTSTMSCTAPLSILASCHTYTTRSAAEFTLQASQRYQKFDRSGTSCSRPAPHVADNLAVSELHVEAKMVLLATQ